jgi:hypothetical protein
MNHFMLGHLVEWHFAYVAGIRQEPAAVGWKRVLFAPQPGPLTHAEGELRRAQRGGCERVAARGRSLSFSR